MKMTTGLDLLQEYAGQKLEKAFFAPDKSQQLIRRRFDPDFFRADAERFRNLEFHFVRPMH